MQGSLDVHKLWNMTALHRFLNTTRMGFPAALQLPSIMFHSTIFSTNEVPKDIE